MSARVKRISQHEAVTYIPRREEFDASALRGRVIENRWQITTGYLSGDDLARLNEERDQITYVVFSYETPIAWYTEGVGWYRVKARFSPTTSSKHQSRLYMIPDPR